MTQKENKTKLSVDLNKNNISELNINNNNYYVKDSIEINEIENYNRQKYIIAIFNKKFEAFQALEKLLENDKKNKYKNKKYKKSTKKVKNKRKKSKNAKDSNLLNRVISVPKLDFTKIFKKYNRKKLQTKEISKINPKFKKINFDDYAI